MSEVKIKEISDKELKELRKCVQEIVLKVFTEETLSPEEIEEIERRHRIITYVPPEVLLRPFTI